MYSWYFYIHSQYFPDRYIRREINNLEVVCPNSEAGCDWEGKFQEYVDHCRTCKFSSSTCPLSILGCSETSMSKAELQQHLATHSVEHLSLLVNKIVALEEQCSPSNSRLKGVKSSGAHSRPRDSGFDAPSSIVMPSKYMIERENPNVPYQIRPHVEESISKRLQLNSQDSLPTSPSLISTCLQPVTRPFLNIFSLQQEELIQIGHGMIETNQHQSAYKVQMQRKDEEIASLRAQVTKLEKQICAKNAECEDRDFRLSLIENSNHDGSMIWKIPQFSQRRADAQSGKYTSIFSLPFYSGRYGYKMCLRLYIMGDGIGKGTHLSLFFVVMRGEFDNILQWPFTHKVTFKLINQAGGRDIVDTFQPDPMSSSFRKPKSNMNIASGCPRFVSHTKLERGGFIVDDTVFIKCMIDTSTIRHP